jgi:hypothetical protein
MTWQSPGGSDLFTRRPHAARIKRATERAEKEKTK